MHCHLLPVGNCLPDGGYAALLLLWGRRREVRHRQMPLGHPVARKRLRRVRALVEIDEQVHALRGQFP